jgi:hypothetical protein
MKNLLLLTLYSLFTLNSFGQDLIITTKGDSLHCKIIKQGELDTKIKIQRKNSMYMLDTYVKNNEIKSIQKNYLGNKTSKVKDEDRISNSQFTIDINYGFSYLTYTPNTSNAPDFFTDYIQELKSGSNLGLSADYFLHKNVGVGLCYNGSKFSNDFFGAGFTNRYGDLIRVDIIDNISLSYIGGNLSLRSISPSGNSAFTGKISLGKASLNYVSQGAKNITRTGSTIAFLLNLGYQHAINKHIALGVSTEYFGCSFNKLIIETNNEKFTATRNDDDESHYNQVRLNINLMLLF